MMQVSVLKKFSHAAAQRRNVRNYNWSPAGVAPLRRRVRKTVA